MIQHHQVMKTKKKVKNIKRINHQVMKTKKKSKKHKKNKKIEKEYYLIKE